MNNTEKTVKLSEKKKRFIELPPVEKFIAGLPEAVRIEYRDIIDELEKNGRLAMPTGEKLHGNMFAIRVIQTANMRVFYVYGVKDFIYGIHAYIKKTQQIPKSEMKQAQAIAKILRQKGWIE